MLDAVSGYVKRLAAGAAVLLLAGAAVAPRGVVALWLTGSALGSSGEMHIYFVDDESKPDWVGHG